MFCRGCGLDKNELDFHAGKKRSYCKSCQAKKAKEYYAKNSEYIRDNVLKYKSDNIKKIRWGNLRRYGCDILFTDFEIIFDKWNGKCMNSGCQIEFDKTIKTPKYQRTYHCDHNHKTGKFRGFLCEDCNHAEGQLKTIQCAQGLVEYMKMTKD